MIKKMIVWALFDSGNGSYTKAIKTLNEAKEANIDVYPLQKPTKFASNINLNLKNDIIKQEIEWKYFSKSYNERSNIPQKLLIDIFKTVIKYFEEQTNDECTSI